MAKRNTANASIDFDRALREACLSHGMDLPKALRFAEEVQHSVAKYRSLVRAADVYERRRQDLAAGIHRAAKRALGLLGRRRRRPGKYNSTIDEMMRDLAELESLKSNNASEYVSSLMPFGVELHMVRWATGQRPPRCQHPRCAGATCKCRSWPKGMSVEAAPPTKFEYLRPVTMTELNPRRYSEEAAAGLLRLLCARFHPKRLPIPRRRGLSLDQDLIDEVSWAFERTGSSASHDSTSWADRLLPAILEPCGLAHLATENRMKRYETHRAWLRKTCGKEVQFLPRMAVYDTSLSPAQREKVMRARLSSLVLETELFFGDT